MSSKPVTDKRLASREFIMPSCPKADIFNARYGSGAVGSRFNAVRLFLTLVRRRVCLLPGIGPNLSATQIFNELSPSRTPYAHSSKTLWLSKDAAFDKS